MTFSSPHAVDLVVAVAVAASQVYLGFVFFRDWKPRLPSRWFRVLRAVLFVLWLISICGILSAITGSRYHAHKVPALLGSLAGAVEIFWGFTSGLSMIVWATYRLLSRRGRGFSPSRRRAVKVATASAMTAPFAIAGIGATIGRTDFRVRELDFPILGLHPDLAGFRIGQLTDLHVSPFLSVREAGRAVDMLNELRPDLTLITGDLISEHGDPLFETIRELSRLRAGEGVLGCLGNHEIYAQCEDLVTSESARFGMRYLRGESRQIRRGQGSLNIAGVDFQRFSNRRHYLRGAERLIQPGMPNLLLSHNPDVFPTAIDQGFDAVVGGHTHGGQVTVEIVSQYINFARFFTPYVAGLYRKDRRSCYVSAGIGTIGMPIRLGALPEVTLLRLVAA